MSAIKQSIKRMLPSTLFGRALMILVLPVILVQLVAIYMFYERHWDSIVRNMSSALAGEVTLLVREFETADKETRIPHTAALGDMMGIGVIFDDSQKQVFISDQGREEHPEFFYLLERNLPRPVMVQRTGNEGDDIQISILMEDGTLQLTTTKKRLVSSTTYIFILWMAGSAGILLVIAILFLRNQIRPIRQLALAAERFGMGQDTPDFSPRGAAEVRQAGKAFVVMRNRIQRQLNTRTEMLAGISHDLRTPLTRVKLQLAMLNLKGKAKEELESDVEEMEHMIQEYLDFVRGDGQETAQPVELKSYLNQIIENYQRHDQPVTLHNELNVTLNCRPKALKRVIQNIIDNAIQYGNKAEISLSDQPKTIQMVIEDEGPGIPEEEHETVFRPFTRLDPSRNVETGGAGLGLSIARDIVLSHGGTIMLANRKPHGLRVMMTFPKGSSEQS